MPTKPQDHQAPKGAPYSFKVGSKSYKLPSADEARNRLDGGDFEDAVLDGELGMLGYLIKALRASGAAPEALKALRTLPQDKYLDVLKEWGEHGDGDGASLGESSR